MAETETKDIHLKIYLAVFVGLLALTVITVSVSYLHLSILPAVILALVVASIKGFLVSGYFMHLVSERRLIYAILILTAIFFLSLMFLPLSAYHDRIVY